MVGAAMTLEMFETNAPDTEGETSTDAYCSPPEFCECMHASINGCTRDELGSDGVLELFGTDIVGLGRRKVRPALDPWTNQRAISHGWVNAATSWTLESGRDPDISWDPRPWPLLPGDYVHGNPRYSAPHEYVERFLMELERAKAWGGLLLKTDNRTQWWRDIQAHDPFIVLWDGPMNFFHLGERIKGNNFASSILVVDHTGMSRNKRYDQLRRAYEGRAWVFR